LYKLAEQAAGLAAPDDPDLADQAKCAAHDLLTQVSEDPERLNRYTSPALANRMSAVIAGVTGVMDPYAGVKAEEMEGARKIFERVRESTDQDLDGLVHLAAVSNSLDFFRPYKEVAAEMAEQMENGFTLHHDDAALLGDYLAQRPKLVLYLTDNSGEIYFDRPLFKRLAEQAEKAVLVVKGGPGLNDLTAEDLAASGLAGEFEHIADTGTPGAGVDWERVSNDFIALYQKADLIVSKGMANFESLMGRPDAPNMFYIFRAKCHPIQNVLSAPPESYWALWQARPAPSTD
jgi:hypothetical protein